MNALPAEWEVAELRDVTTDISYGFTTSSVMNGAGPKLLRITDIQNGSVNWSTVPHCVDTPRASFLLQAGDIVIARTGATTGKSFLLEELPFPTAFASYLIRARVSAEIDPKYVSAFMQSEGYWSQIQIVSKGTAQPGANAQLLSKLKFPIAPLAEQRRIVAKIDSLSAKSKRAHDHLNHIPHLIDKYKQAILACAFRGELTADWRLTREHVVPIEPRSPSSIRAKYRSSSRAGHFVPPFEIPKGWQWLRIRELGDLDRGKSRHRPRNDKRLFGGPYPFIQTGEVRAADRYLSKFSTTYNELGLAQSRLWAAGTVCITIAANIAETAILKMDACFPDSVVGFVADDERTSAEYVEYVMRTVRADLERFAPATAQKNINLDTLGNIRLPIAPLNEQREIVRRLDHAFTEIDRLGKEAASARRLLERLDRAILAEAFSGGLVPQDPADEPASKLLERIRAERSSTPRRLPNVERGKHKVARG